MIGILKSKRILIKAFYVIMNGNQIQLIHINLLFVFFILYY